MASSPVIIQVATPGPAGPAGPSGATGPAGYSPRYYVQSGVPTSGVGLAGDMYINSTNSDVWGPKIDNTTWPATPACNIRGIAGYSPLYIVAAGTPPGATGNIGDMYINSTTSDLYGPKSAGGWGPIVANLKGATGSTGPQGPPGVAAIPRGAWASGVLYNQGDLVTDASQSWICLVNHTSSAGNRPSLPSPATWQATAAGGTQTPWATDIDGNGKKLLNPSWIGIGTAIVPLGGNAIATRGYLTVKGSPDAGVLELAHSGADVSGALCGQISFVDGNQAGADKRVVILNAPTDGATATNRGGALQIFTKPDSGAVAERIRITGAGFVGIGTGAPQGRLHVSSGSDASEGILVSGADAARFLVIQNKTATGARIQQWSGSGFGDIGINPDGGRVGIGTGATAPLTPLHVMANVTRQLTLSGTGAPSTSCVKIGYDVSNNTGVIDAVNGGTGTFLLLNPTGGTYGRVGIGTTSPASALHVGGPQNATGGISIATDTNDPNIYGYQIYRGAAGELNLIGNQSGAAAFVFGNATERMRIAASGNVGIGVASPASLLDLRTPGISANTDVLTLSAGSTGATNAEQRIKFVSAGTYNLGYIGVGFDPTTAVDGYIAFGTGGNGPASEKVRIAYNGNVGIKKIQTPADLLTVGGITYAANSNGGIRIQSAGAEWTMRMALKSDSGGIPRGAFEFGGVELFAINGVGIAIKKAAAVYPLDVFGDINYTGTLRQNGNPVSFGGEGTVYVAYASTFLALATTRQDVPGATVTLTRAGRYLITGVFSFNKPTGAADQDVTCLGSLVAGGSLQGQEAVFCVLGGATVGGIATVAQQWVYVAAAGAVAKLQAYKNAGTGASATETTKTSISAVWIAST